MLKVKNGVDLTELEKYGFKYGARDKFIYKTTKNGKEAKIYIDLLPCHNNNNELNIEAESFSIPEKIVNTLYDLIQARISDKGVIISE